MFENLTKKQMKNFMSDDRVLKERVISRDGCGRQSQNEKKMRNEESGKT